MTASALVLTLSDFNALGAVAHPWQAAALGEAMSKGPLVLAGTSFRDVDIRQWLHAIATQQRPHGAPVLALVAREGLGLSRRQFADVADAMRRQWAAVGIEALLVQDHSESAQLLREIPAAGLVDYSVPQDRAARLWREHVEEFTERQASHSALLEFDRQNLPARSGHDTDLTLWLADGSSELTRWSSHDRLYRTPENLRRVPLGHDSPWTAARAISRNEVLVEAAAPPPTGSRRWRTIVAGPLTATLPGGPNLVVGALSAATTADIGEDEEEWRTAIADLVEVWGDRVAGTAR